MALLWRDSPTFLGSRPCKTGEPHEPSLRACATCAITTLAPRSPASAPSTPTTPTTPTQATQDAQQWRSHDHPTIFVRAAGHVSSLASMAKIRSASTYIEAGIGVSFASPSRYDLAEPLPRSVAAGDGPIRRNQATPNRAEVFAAIRALDRVKGVLAAATRDRSEGGWEAMLGGMFGSAGRRRLAPGVTLPGKVEEVVILTRSEYVISAITAAPSAKAWRSTPAGQRRFPSSTSDGAKLGHQRNPSLSSLTSVLSRSSQMSSVSTKSKSASRTLRKQRSWLHRRGTRARKADYDLLFELDLLCEELAATYGVRVCFHKSVVNEAARLAKKGAAASLDGEEA